MSREKPERGVMKMKVNDNRESDEDEGERCPEKPVMKTKVSRTLTGR